eukprot:152962-Pelagomonas_calceolata.AAC.2
MGSCNIQGQGMGCSPSRGVWRHSCSKPIQTSRIVTMYKMLLPGAARWALCGLASQLWVPGRT